MLDLKRVWLSRPKPHTSAPHADLQTEWSESITPATVLQEQPNPQFARESYTNLNGLWSYAITEAPEGLSPYDKDTLLTAVLEHDLPQSFQGDILVPFSPEAALSGVGTRLNQDQLLWYSCTFDAPALYDTDKLMVHFEAVDYVCSVWCNGRLAGTHVGGYTPFAIDVTELVSEGQNQLLLCVADPSEYGVQLRGKQRIDRGGIWYTAQSGIWQSVWMEIVPQTHIKSIAVAAIHNSDTAIVTCCLHAAQSDVLTVTAFDAQGNQIAREAVTVEQGTTEAILPLEIPNHENWEPDSPVLYYLTVRLGIDVVDSYFAFRTAEVRHDEKGIPRFFLNGSPLFLKGALDQGYWPESLMTAPSDEALAFDIAAAKALGFNMLRKHIKIESRRWYYHADRQGMLVWQDMVSGGSPLGSWQSSYKPTLFQRSWRAYSDRSPVHMKALSAGDQGYQEEWLETCKQTVDLLKGHPCIVTWVLFNEGWGQFDARGATELVRGMDPTRPIDAVSGWYDQACGDFISEHNYFRPLEVNADPHNKRAYVISEFGGLTWAVEGHCCQEESYGYQSFESFEQWKNAMRRVRAKAERLERHGLSGYVYTQLTDVEEETNGLLTYDRRPKDPSEW